MGWKLLKKSELPLGKRVLGYGDQGADVRELQKRLAQAGFYFGETDGIFGVLTEEAVVLLQKAFELRIDGRAGREVRQALDDTSRRSGRIVHIVKARENLNAISQKFSVQNEAWKGICGPGNPRQRIYPGMKLLLHEKAFFHWGAVAGSAAATLLTGNIGSDFRLTVAGGLEGPDNAGADRHQAVAATGEVWGRLLAMEKLWPELGRSFQKGSSVFGLDLREAPWEGVVRWVDLVRFLVRNGRRIRFVVIPLPLWGSPGERNRLERVGLPLLFKEVDWILVEPVYDLTSPESLLDTAALLEKALKRFLQAGWSGKIILTESVQGWNWNLEQGSFHETSYREARLIQNINPRGIQSCHAAKLTQVRYRRHRESNSLIFRTEADWEAWLRLTIKYNLLGAAIRNAAQLGRAGDELATKVFAVLPGSKLAMGRVEPRG
jgi:hypothetical protein